MPVAHWVSKDLPKIQSRGNCVSHMASIGDALKIVIERIDLFATIARFTGSRSVGSLTFHAIGTAMNWAGPRSSTPHRALADH
jgi:hypothetical protein